MAHFYSAMAHFCTIKANFLSGQLLCHWHMSTLLCHIFYSTQLLWHIVFSAQLLCHIFYSVVQLATLCCGTCAQFLLSAAVTLHTNVIAKVSGAHFK